MQERIKEIMAKVFNIPVDTIADDISPDDVEAWDSLRHMHLVIALEEEFSVEFGDQQIMDMMNLPLIVITVGELTGNA